MHKLILRYEIYLQRITNRIKCIKYKIEELLHVSLNYKNYYILYLTPGNPDETHEEFTMCGASCEATCKRRRPGFLCDLLSICQPGYVCENGYLRDSNTGQCVLPFECPRTHRSFWPWGF